MPKRIPKYSHHRPTGLARVTIAGKCHYLGPFNSPESRERYEQLISRWLAGADNVELETLSIGRLAILYLDHCREYYRKEGRVTSEVLATQAALRPLTEKYSGERVSQFGPRKLKSIRDTMITAGAARSTINGNIRRVVRMLKWGVENELVEPGVYQACRAISGLRRGRSEARETDPVQPVPEDDIAAIRPFVSNEVWGMIQLQLVTGMRPGEVCILRSKDLDRSDVVWRYRPQTHKTAHHGRQRLIFIGPRGQQILRPFLELADQEYVFSPTHATKVHNDSRRNARKSPMTPSQAARHPKNDAEWKPGPYYRRDSYSRAIARGCRLASVCVWSPNRLRHNAATELRKKYPIESVRTVLGHSTAFTTEIYAELDFDAARSLMALDG